MWLGGGEPTLRADLPQLVTALTEAGHTVGLQTDGALLYRASTLQTLVDAGIRAVRLSVHSLVNEAHDWLMGTEGAAKRARKAASNVAAMGLRLDGETLVTRSTTTHIVDVVRFFGTLNAKHHHIHFPQRRGAADAQFVTLSPRLGLAEPYLEAAYARGRDAGVAVWMHGLPRCAAPRVPAAAFVPETPWLWAPSIDKEASEALSAPETAAGCPRCPGPPVCAGPLRAYVARFGRLEVDDPGLVASPPIPDTPRPRGEAPHPPPARQGRGPVTRLRAPIRQAALDNLGGDPLVGTAHNPVPLSAVRIRFRGSSRNVRVALVRAAQQGVPHLIVDEPLALDREDAHALLREAVRVGFSRVSVAGDLTHLARLGRRPLARLKEVTHWFADLWAPSPEAHNALRGEGHYAASEAALATIAQATGAQVAWRALLPPHPGDLGPWTEAWPPHSTVCVGWIEAPDVEAYRSVLPHLPADFAHIIDTALTDTASPVVEPDQLPA